MILQDKMIQNSITNNIGKNKHQKTPNYTKRKPSHAHATVKSKVLLVTSEIRLSKKVPDEKAVRAVG